MKKRRRTHKVVLKKAEGERATVSDQQRHGPDVGVWAGVKNQRVPGEVERKEI